MRTSCKMIIFFGFIISFLTLTFALPSLSLAYTFSVVSGNLPPGLTLSSAGVISGTPTEAGIYTFAVKVTDSASNEATREFTLTVKEQDSQAPAKVSNFTATPGDGEVTLSWINPADDDFEGTIIVYRNDRYPTNYNDGALVRNFTNSPGSNDVFLHLGLQNCTPYYYAAFAYDTDGNYSEPSTAMAVPGSNCNVFLPVTNLTAYPNDQRITLVWANPDSANLAGITIRYSLNVYPEDPEDGELLCERNGKVGERGSFTHKELENGVTYYYSVFAYDTNGYYSEPVTISASPQALSAGTYQVVFGNTEEADFPGTIEDTFININNENASNSEYLNTYTWPEDSIANAIIIKWDLSAIPENVEILDAKLYLYLGKMDGGGDDLYDISVHSIINHDPVVSLCTGYTYDDVNPWTPHSGLYNDIPLAQADITLAEDVKSIDKTFGYKEWTVTEMVTDWLLGLVPDCGMLINSDPVASMDSNRYFCSSEFQGKDRRPKLAITYQISGGGGDTVPPGDVTDFTATPGNGEVTLSWINPIDSDFAGTMIRYSTDTYPVDHNDGIFVCNKENTPGSSDSSVHKGLENGTAYYYSAFSYDLAGNYSETAHASATPLPDNNPPTEPEATQLQNGEKIPMLSGSQESERHFFIQVPSGTNYLEVKIWGGSGNCDLYVRYGSQATIDNWDYRSRLNGNNEKVDVSDPQPGKWYIMLKGHASYSNVSLRVKYWCNMGKKGNRE